MYVYIDRHSGDIEVLSDAFKFKSNGIVYEVPGKMVTEKTDNNFDIGANPSAEEQAEELECGETVQFDVVKAYYLEKCDFISDKKALLDYFKEYMKLALQSVPEDELGEFKKGANAFVKKVALEFDDYIFFMGKDADLEKKPLLIPMKYNEDGMSGTFYYLKAGLLAQKM